MYLYVYICIMYIYLLDYQNLAALTFGQGCTSRKEVILGIFFVKELLQTLLKIFYILADSDASDKIHKCYHGISKDLFQIFVLIFLDFFSNLILTFFDTFFLFCAKFFWGRCLLGPNFFNSKLTRLLSFRVNFHFALLHPL